MSGLSVNFDKCSVIGINMQPSEVCCVAEMLGCQVGSLPLDFLGLKVGEGIKRAASWEDVVDKVRKRSAGWNVNHISMGGRVSLIKSVLAAIPIYRLAFSSIPARTEAKLRSIFCRFLWGEKEGGPRKMAWTKWEDLCKQKKEGGLGIKNLAWMNQALLTKWVWRFVKERENLWAKVLRSRHGELCLNGVDSGTGGRVGRGKGWWYSIQRFILSERGTWFNSKLARVLGDGSEIRFWEDKWCGDLPLRLKFPRLFQISAAKGSYIREMGVWNVNDWKWELSWRRPLRDREMVAVSELLQCVENVVPRRDCPDSWKWGDSGDGDYSVRKGYLSLESESQTSSTSPYNVKEKAEVWGTIAPFKHQLTAWRLLCNRLPTRVNLSRRMEISVEGKLCPCCAVADESAEHLFLHCKDVAALWGQVISWAGIKWASPGGILAHFHCFSSLVGRKKGKRIMGGLWTCVTGTIWKWRNKAIFKNSEWDFSKMLADIKRTMWSWLVAKGIVEPRVHFCDWEIDFLSLAL